jgi:hypothetical protein
MRLFGASRSPGGGETVGVWAFIGRVPGWTESRATVQATKRLIRLSSLNVETVTAWP